MIRKSPFVSFDPSKVKLLPEFIPDASIMIFFPSDTKVSAVFKLTEMPVTVIFSKFTTLLSSIASSLTSWMLICRVSSPTPPSTLSPVHRIISSILSLLLLLAPDAASPKPARRPPSAIGKLPEELRLASAFEPNQP